MGSGRWWGQIWNEVAEALQKAFPHKAAGDSQEFEVQCECGQRLHGRRLPQRLIVPCRRCGELLFVFPVSPYPRPTPPKGMAEEVLQPEEPPVVAQPVPEESVQASGAAGAPPAVAIAVEEGTSELVVPAAVAAATPAATPPVTPPAARPAQPPVPPERLAQVLRRRTLLLGMVVSVVLVATIVLVFWHRTRQIQRQALEEHFAAGQRALRQGDLAEALEHFEQVRLALRWLGSDDSLASVRHLSEEVLNLRQLVRVEGHRILTQLNLSDPEAWASAFQGAYVGQYVLLDVQARRLPDAHGRIALQLFSVVGEQLLEWEVAGPSELEALLDSDSWARVIFLARFAGIRPGEPKVPGVVRLDGSSARVVTTTDLLKAQGWPLSPQDEQLVEAQRARLFGGDVATVCPLPERTAYVAAWAPAEQLGAGPAFPRTVSVAFWLAWPFVFQEKSFLPLLADELEKIKPEPDKSVYVYGKVQVRTGRSGLYLQRCRVRFELLEPERYPSGVTWVFLRGRFALAQEGWRVEVEDIRRAPSPEQVFDQYVSLLEADDVVGWEEALRWASRLAEDYGVSAMKERIALARQKRLDAELKTIGSGDLRQLEEFLQRREAELPKPTSQILRHRLARLHLHEVQRRTDAGADEWLTLARRLEQLLPRGRVAGRRLNGAQEAQYQADPENFYREHPELQASCDRLLVATAWIHYYRKRSHEAAEGELRDLAREATKALPDFGYIGAELWRLWVRRQRDRLRELMRTDALELVDTIRKVLRDEELAKAVLAAWLQHRRQLVSPDDLVGLLELARDYQDLIQEHQEAAQLLAQVLRIDPAHPEARSRLRTLGYRLEGQRWVGPEGKVLVEVKTEASKDSQRPAHTVGPGASVEEVRRAFGGQPAYWARIGTAMGLTECWVYELHSAVVCVYFTLGPAGSHRVVDVRQAVR
jgi:predicted SprT family Zn-dependent metalloprotease